MPLFAPRPGPARGGGRVDHDRGEATYPRGVTALGETLDGPLPEPVRQRVVALASDALGSMSDEDVPASLRPFVRFTPHKRARLAATPIAAALEHDSAFRQRVAERIRTGTPDLAGALERGVAAPAADPLDVAAAAYLLRPPGWTERVEAADREIARVRRAAESAQTEDAVLRLQGQLDAARAAARADVERLRAELEATKAELAELRRKLGELRGRARAAEEGALLADKAAATARADAAAVAAAAELEGRRMRARLADAEQSIEAGRRAARENRSLHDSRLRLLLDTIVDSATGLRRELALPPVGLRPADTIAAVVAEAAGTADVAGRALAEDDPELLDALLALPQVHLLVDGYNVTKSGYGSLPLEAQRSRLVAGLGALAAQTGAEVTCVFDGADLETRLVAAPARGVRVLFSPPGESADEVIRRLARAEPPGRPVVVVSSDREVAEGVRAAGARPLPSAALLRRLQRS
jgi:predicted RNA-binding protein with PIN domain